MTDFEDARTGEARPQLRFPGLLSNDRPARATARGGTGKSGDRGMCGEEGSTLIEFALSCLILLAVLFGVIESSLLAYTYHYISDAAREGSRYAIVRGSECTGLTDCPDVSGDQIQTYVRNLGYPGIVKSKMTVTTTWYAVTWDTSVKPNTAVMTSCGAAPAGCDTPGNMVQVHVQYAFPVTLPFWGSSPVTLNSTSRLAISQ